MKSILLIIFHFKLVKYTNQSIAGVTYMDHFDFEDRYRNVYECDPFYWHPLHLPEHCAEMYEKVLRSKVASTIPLRILKKKEHFLFSYEDMSEEDNSLSHESESIDVSHKFNLKSLTPYEKMLDYLRRDVTEDPKAPVMEMLPNFGPVTVYKQPVSRRSEKIINKIAKAYAKSKQKAFEETESYYGQIDVKSPTKNDDSGEINTSKNLKKTDKVFRLKKKTKNGGTLTIKRYVR